VPAYDHLLKLSHTFNVLDARGAVGVTERADCFATMRALAREVTGEWWCCRGKGFAWFLPGARLCVLCGFDCICGAAVLLIGAAQRFLAWGQQG
jgi:hypothetical protein